MDDHLKQFGLAAGVGAAIGVGVALGLGLRLLATGALVGIGAGVALGLASGRKAHSGGDDLQLESAAAQALH